MVKKFQIFLVRVSLFFFGLLIFRNRYLIVNFVVGVGDFIWVGRFIGDILIINVKFNV